MLPYILAVLVGVIAGLRTMTAPAAIAWAARLGILQVQNTPLVFLSFLFTPAICTMLAITELLADQLPTTPSRKVPIQFAARLVSGGFCGAAIGIGIGSFGWILGAGLGVAGSVIGTLGGHAGRARLARAFGRDVPAALLEDAVAIGGGVLVVWALRFIR